VSWQRELPFGPGRLRLAVSCRSRLGADRGRQGPAFDFQKRPRFHVVCPEGGKEGKAGRRQVSKHEPMTCCTRPFTQRRR